MIAPWVVLIGLYCCEVGRWLQPWHREQLQALQQPDNPVGFSRAAAKAALAQYAKFCEELIGYPTLKRVESLWETGTDSSDPDNSSSSSSDDDVDASGGSSMPGDQDRASGAECVGMWQQWQQLTAAAAAGTEATAATAAASQQAAVAPDSKQPPQLPQQQQQQQQMPAYGSLEEEFSLLSSDAMCQWEDTWLLVNLTRKHLKRLKRRAMLESGDQRPRSSSSSSSEDSNIDDSSSGESSSGDGEEDDSSDDGQCVFGQHLIELQRRLRGANTIQSSMQACLGYQGFTDLAEPLQEVGEAICAKVPVPWMRNNPGCTCMEGASELQLVGGKACVCGGCRVAR
jgi:hypothetical protein